MLTYGASVSESYRLTGEYVGRILKGDRPSDLPAQRATAVELVVNLSAAASLGLNAPRALLGRADDTIE